MIAEIRKAHTRSWWASSSRTGTGLATTFKSRTESDGGVFEADSCVAAQLQSLLSNGAYDLASLILVPSGYKESKLYSAKPTNGGGDFGHTRAGTSTRKGQSLVEQVPYNLFTRSSDYTQAVWTKTATTATSNEITGANSVAIHNVNQSRTSEIGTYTFQVELKYVNHRYVQIWQGGVSAVVSPYVNVDLLNGTITQQDAQNVATITALANGWFRISCRQVTTASGGLIGAIAFIDLGTSARNSTSTTTGVEKFNVRNAQLTIGTSELSSFTTTDRFNVPKLDYTGASCPSILLEPARTNLVLRSEELDNASWAKGAATAITANADVAPDGLSTADLVTNSGVGSTLRTANITVTASTVYTASWYAKKGTIDTLSYKLQDVTGAAAIVTASYLSSLSASEYTRITVTFTTPVGCTSVQLFIQNDTPATGTFYAWGAQLEAGSYATSYIPTTSATVTRIADVIPALLPAGTNQLLQSQMRVGRKLIQLSQ
jgi:hypothetical protein